MAPSRKRTVVEAKAVARRGAGACACLSRPHSDGLCELNVWQGTTLEPATTRLLRPRLPIVKYKELTLDGLSGFMYRLVLFRWAPLLALFGAIYIAVVGVFALFFALCNENLAVHESKARDYFNLSIQTMATIGYGVLFPKDSCSNWVAVFESFVSMIVISLMTGIAFVKFARPRPHMIFSETFTVSQRADGGGLEMRFRIVNGTRRELIMKGEILEVSFKLILMRIEETKRGEKKMCYYDLHLKTTSYITLRLEADIIHEIEGDSPFYGMTRDDLAKSDFLLILMMSGVDETLHDMVHQQFEYSHEHLRWGEKFVPLLAWDRNTNYIELDFDKVSATEPAPIEESQYPSLPDNLRITINRIDETRLSTTTEGNVDMTDELDDSLINVAGDEDAYDTARIGHSWLAPPPSTNAGGTSNVDYSDLESIRSFQEDQKSVSDVPNSRFSPTAEEDDSNSGDGGGRKSVVSTSTNSGSDNDERHETTPMHHVRFDSRRSTAAIRFPRISRRHRRGVSNPLQPAGNRRRHTHEPHRDLHEEPMSLLRRRVRFKNHPLSRFSKGLYYRALETSWFRLFLYLAFIYFASIAFIALLMHLSSGEAVLNPGNVEVARPYERIFFFCAQTISTIGYGALAPNPSNDAVNFYVCLLSVAGMIVSTLVTGLAWAKFSIPKASTIAFSDYLLLTAFHSHRAIMFRAANTRQYGAIIEGSFRVSVVILNQRLGHKETHELKLVRNVWPIVQLAATVTHIIDEDSPLFDISTDELLSGRHFFVVLFSGLDPIVGENMFSRKTYHSCDILVGHHFVDNIKLAPDGVHVDLEAMNDTTLTPEIDLRESRLYPATTRDHPNVEEDSDQPPADRINPVDAKSDENSRLQRWQQSELEDAAGMSPRAAQYVLM